MNQHRLVHTLPTAAGLPHARVLAIFVAVLINITTCIPVIAQQGDPVEQGRPEKPVLRNENNVSGPKTWIDLGPEINICRGC
jgi:hypothetical protein